MEQHENNQSDAAAKEQSGSRSPCEARRMTEHCPMQNEPTVDVPETILDCETPKQAALYYRVKCGFSVVPIIPHSKACYLKRTNDPDSGWKPYQTKLPTVKQVEAWWTRWADAWPAIVCGKVSGRNGRSLTVIDSDRHHYEYIRDKIDPKTGQVCLDKQGRPEKEYGPRVYDGTGVLEHDGEAHARALFGDDDCCIQNTSCGGRHRFYMTEVAYATGDLGDNWPAVDVQAEGGLIFAYPAPRREWRDDPADAILDAPKGLVEILDSREEEKKEEVAPEPAEVQTREQWWSGGFPEAVKPGEDFNSRGSVLDVLEKHGWQVHHGDDRQSYLTRPGKDPKDGISATYNGSVFYVFSTNSPAPFEANKGYSNFAVFALLEYGGDWSAAGKALRAQGYGVGLYVPKAVAQQAQAALDAMPERLRALILAEDYSPVHHRRIMIERYGTQWVYIIGRGWAVRSPEPGGYYVMDVDNAQIHNAVAEMLEMRARAIAASCPDGLSRRDVSSLTPTCIRINDILNDMSKQPRLRRVMDEFDERNNELNTRDGVWEIRTGTIRARRDDDLFSQPLQCSYRPELGYRLWDDYITSLLAPASEWKSDPEGTRQRYAEEVRMFRRYVAYSLSGETKEKVVIYLEGPQWSGKTSLVDIISEMFDLPDRRNTSVSRLVGECPPGLVDDAKGVSETSVEFALAEITTCRLLIGREITGRLDAVKIKRISGNEKTRTACVKSKQAFPFHPRMKLWLASNNLPEQDSTDIAAWGRLRIFHFVNVFDGSYDPRERLLSEEGRSQFLNWVIEGGKDYYRNGLGETAEMKQRREAARDDQSILPMFVERFCRLDPDADGGATHEELLEAYNAHRHKLALFSVSIQRFLSEIRTCPLTKDCLTGWRKGGRHDDRRRRVRGLNLNKDGCIMIQKGNDLDEPSND